MFRKAATLFILFFCAASALYLREFDKKRNEMAQADEQYRNWLALPESERRVYDVINDFGAPERRETCCNPLDQRCVMYVVRPSEEYAGYELLVPYESIGHVTETMRRASWIQEAQADIACEVQ